MRTYLVYSIHLNLILISLSAFMVATCAGQLTVDVLPPELTTTITLNCPTPSFDPGSDRAGLERAVQLAAGELPFLDLCFGNALRVGTDLVTDCSMAGSPLAGWRITQVGTVKPCHSGTIISSPSGRFYYLDHYYKPFFSCMSDVVEMLRSFDSNGNPIWGPKPGPELDKLTLLIPFCGTTDFSLDLGNPFGKPLDFQCPATGSVSSIGSVSAISSASADSECRLPVQTGSLPVLTVSSFDPNTKLGSVGVGPQQYLSASQPSPYSIAFENVASATAPAQSVTVIDQLDTAHLDLSTFALGPMGFGNQQIVPPPGLSQFSTYVDLRPAVNVIVGVNALLNKATGTATWSFNSLDPSTGQAPTNPLVGFLPPNVVPPQGDGQVLFSVFPKSGLSTGQQINNNATVVFDVNPPVVTPTWSNTLDNSPPVSNVLPLAAQSPANFTVSWHGTDVGSGIENYTIYVSDNGGPFTAWMTNTIDTADVYPGVVGHTYGFFSHARDFVGNVEPLKTSAEATTTVMTPFSALAAKLDISVGPPSNFDLNSSFTLGAASNGINPLTENVTFQIGAYSVTIPAGSFTKNNKGAYVFEGTINGVSIQVRINPTGGNSYTFQAEGSGANFSGITNPVTVNLKIGNDAGSTQINAQIS